VIDLRDPKAREEFLMAELNNANQKLMEGRQFNWREQHQFMS